MSWFLKSMIFDRVVFSELTPFIRLTWCPKNTDVFMSLFISEPVMAHNSGFRALELNAVVDISISHGIVYFNGVGWLGMLHFF